MDQKPIRRWASQALNLMARRPLACALFGWTAALPMVIASFIVRHWAGLDLAMLAVPLSIWMAMVRAAAHPVMAAIDHGRHLVPALDLGTLLRAGIASFLSYVWVAGFLALVFVDFRLTGGGHDLIRVRNGSMYILTFVFIVNSGLVCDRGITVADAALVHRVPGILQLFDMQKAISRVNKQLLFNVAGFGLMLLLGALGLAILASRQLESGTGVLEALIALAAFETLHAPFGYCAYRDLFEGRAHNLPASVANRRKTAVTA